MEVIQYRDIWEILPEGTFTEDYCGTRGAFLKWEARINPILKSLGYGIVKDWTTGERDSFGPLSRVITLEKDGITQQFFYG